MRQKRRSVAIADFSHLHWTICYGLAAGFVAVALLLNFIPAAQSLPFLFFFGAVAITARICGFGPALFATFLSGAAANYFFMPPRFAFAHSYADILRVSFFALVCLLISSLAKQRSLVEKESEEDRAKLAAIVASSQDAIFSKTLEGTITTWNKGAQQLYGYTAAEIIGQNVAVLAGAEGKAEILGIMETLRRGGRVEHQVTERFRKDGSAVTISLSVSPLFDSDGKVVGAASIARDITAQKLAEETLRKTEKLAAAGRLSASIAHEINNPLEAVTNLLYLLQRNQSLDEKARRHLKTADDELRRVAHLARQTLGFYRDSSSASKMNVETALDEVLELYLRKLSASRIRVEKDYAGSAEVVAFAGEIRQVFSNLISNAIDAMPNGGRIKVRVANSYRRRAEKTPGVRITVADTGSGIGPAHKAKIFEAFYTTKKDVGTGLGLWLTKEIVQKHEGSISLRSSTRAGCSGTVFSIFLPSGDPAAEPKQRKAEALEQESAADSATLRSA
jgi:PAS domain S-box-containing protein